MKYYVQETIGGWRQNAIFSGSKEECESYLYEWCDYSRSCWNIVPEDEYEVDYL